MIALDLKGLAVSTGAACSSGAIEPSHVLTAMGLRRSVREPASVSAWASKTPREDVEFALEPDSADGCPAARAVSGIQ